MIYTIRHKTTLHYTNLVRLARFNLRLAPVAWPTQIISDHRLEVSPRPARIRQESGPWLVNETHLEMREPLAKLEITSSFRAEVFPPSPTWPAPQPHHRRSARHGAGLAGDLAHMPRALSVRLAHRGNLARGDRRMGPPMAA
jgi:hypothetical protein